MPKNGNGKKHGIIAHVAGAENRGHVHGIEKNEKANR